MPSRNQDLSISLSKKRLHAEWRRFAVVRKHPVQFLMSLLMWVALFTSIAVGEQIGAGKSGDELIQLIRINYRPASTLSYKQARRAMFEDIDNRNGKSALRLYRQGNRY